MLSAFARLPRHLPVVAWLVCSSLRAADGSPGKIEAREPRAQIRAEILTATKPGVTPDAVLAFIATNFHLKAGHPAPKLSSHPAVGPTARGSALKGVQSIRLVLGHYVANPAPLLMEIPMIVRTTTAVQWAFGGDGKLIEVFVDKDTELGDGKGPDD